jgi:hypothetical protein
MCAEKAPLTCRRCILVSRHLMTRRIDVHHILADGRLESDVDALARLLRELQLPELFRPRGELIDEAYRVRGDEIAYVEEIAESEPMRGVAR